MKTLELVENELERTFTEIVSQNLFFGSDFSRPKAPVDTGRKLNVHKTFRRRPGRLLNVLCTFNLRPVSTGAHVLESNN